MKILLVEDDDEIRQIERDYLMKENLEVLEAYDGEAALKIFTSNEIDLVILDLNLPKIDGVTVCKSIRLISPVPILMVTARTKEVDELIGLEVGADDYVKKPFSPKVLVARVKSLLKRPNILLDRKILQVRDLVIDVEKQTIKKNGIRKDLTTLQFNILLQLAASPGRIFTREELMDRAYDTNIPPDIFDRTIDSHIKNIRKEIEDDPKYPTYIETVYGKGYRFLNA